MYMYKGGSNQHKSRTKDKVSIFCQLWTVIGDWEYSKTDNCLKELYVNFLNMFSIFEKRFLKNASLKVYASIYISDLVLTLFTVKIWRKKIRSLFENSIKEYDNILLNCRFKQIFLPEVFNFGARPVVLFWQMRQQRAGKPIASATSFVLFSFFSWKYAKVQVCFFLDVYLSLSELYLS